MPPVRVRRLLCPRGEARQAHHEVRVTCTYGIYSICYIVPVRKLARIVPLKRLRPAAPAARYGAYLDKSSGAVAHYPLTDGVAATARGATLLYTTAGKYHGALDAADELHRLPKRGGKKTVVVTEADAPDAADDSPDTECDSDGQPLPRSQGRQAKRRPKRKKRAPQQENLAYRAEVVARQADDLLDTYTVNHLGDELCTVLAQLLSRLQQEGTFSECAVAHLYTTASWLRAVRRQARAAGNEAIASVASRLLMEEVRGREH